MNKLKKILLEEGTTFVPFSFAFNKINKYWTAQKKYEDSTFFEKVNGIRRWGLNTLISAVVPTMIFGYTIASLSTGTLNYTKWSEASKQKEIRMDQEARDYSKKRFYEADRNGNFVLDPNEFYDCVHGQRR